MKMEKAERMVEKLQDEGYEARLYEGYSGRGMFGRETTGVSTDAHPTTAAAVTGVRCSSDNLGLGYILY